MCDIFLAQDVRQLFKGKHVVFMGDSNVRALYKDLVCLSEKSKFISDKNLRSKLPNSVYGDKLVFSGPLCNGRNYREEREKHMSGNMDISYFFLTRVFDDYVESVVRHITSSSDKPDVVIVNSCVWDISRWGPNGIKMYKQNLVKLMKLFQKYLPKNCLVIWVTTPPIAQEMKGGFLVKELQFLKYSLRFHVVESNYFARKIVVSHGYDVLDFHFHLRMQLHRRASDGVHWLPEAVRYLLNLLLTHISLAWGKPLPHRYDSAILDRCLEDKNKSEDVEIEVTCHSAVSDVSKTDEHLSSDRSKQVIADREERPAGPKRAKITAPSLSTPQKLPNQNTEKENSSSVTNRRRKKRGRINGSCGAFMKKLQQEDRHKKKGYHQSSYVSNFVPDVSHVSIPLLRTPQVPFIQNPGYYSPHSSAIPNSPFLSPYSPSQPVSLYSPSEFSSPCSIPQHLLQSPSLELALYSPAQPLKSYVNHQYDIGYQPPKMNGYIFGYQSEFRNDVATFSSAYRSFE